MNIGDRLRTISKYLAANADELAGTMSNEGYFSVKPAETGNGRSGNYLIHGNPVAILEHLIDQRSFFGAYVTESPDFVSNCNNANISKLDPSGPLKFSGDYKVMLNDSNELVLDVPRITLLEPTASMYTTEENFVQNARMSGVVGDLAAIAKKLYQR